MHKHNGMYTANEKQATLNASFSWVPFCHYFALNIVNSVPLEDWHRKPMDRISVSIIKTLKNRYTLINRQLRSNKIEDIRALFNNSLYIIQSAKVCYINFETAQWRKYHKCLNTQRSLWFDSIWLDGSRCLEQETPPCNEWQGRLGSVLHIRFFTYTPIQREALMKTI